MHALKLSAAIVLLCLWLPCAEARAATAGYLLEFKAYKEAVSKGDLPLARDHAEKAWRLSIEEGAPSESRAILAQNYIEITIVEDPELVLEPLQDAMSLARSGYGITNYSLVALELMDVYVALEVKPRKGKSGKLFLEKLRLIRALDNDSGGFTDANGVSILLVKITIKAAIKLNEIRKYRTSEAISAELSYELETANPSPPKEWLAGTLLLRTNSIISQYRDGFDRKIDQRRLNEAAILTDFAVSLFPVQASIENFDENFAMALAWRGALSSAFKTWKVKEDKEQIFEGKKLQDRMIPAIRRLGADGEPVFCELDWLEREPPKFPNGALYLGRIGSVLVGYHLGDDGKVVEPRVMAEVPSRVFGEVVLKQVAKWQVTPSSVRNERCLRDHFANVSFVIQE